MSTEPQATIGPKGLFFSKRRGWFLLRRSRVVVAVAVGVLAFIALAGPLIAPYDPNAIDLSIAYSGSSVSHPLGTDASGRDILSRLLTGARISLAAPMFIALVATFIGSVLSLTAAWRGGLVDALISRVLDMMFAFPGLLLAMLVVGIFGKGIVAPVIALAIAFIPWVGRVVRSALLRERQLPYITVLESQGMSGVAICVRHLFPNVTRTVSAQGALVFGYAMVDLAAINFLGLGVQPPTSDWGVMVSTGQQSLLRGNPQETLFAGACIVIAVIVITMVSQAISDDESSTVRSP